MSKISQHALLLNRSSLFRLHQYSFTHQVHSLFISSHSFKTPLNTQKKPFPTKKTQNPSPISKMQFTSSILLAILATTALAATPSPTQSAESPEVSCLNACTRGDVYCEAACVGAAHPHAPQASNTIDCVRNNCPVGDGTVASNAKYQQCVQSCIANDFPTTASAAAGAPGSQSTGNFAGPGSSNSMTAGAAGGNGASGSSAAGSAGPKGMYYGRND